MLAGFWYKLANVARAAALASVGDLHKANVVTNPGAIMFSFSTAPFL